MGSRIAFVFPGQGAQYVGMGRDLYESRSAARAVFDLLDDRTRALCFEGPAEELGRTLNTQPALFAMNLACARALEAEGIHAEGAAGFSLGEISALAFAGLLDDAAAFGLVRKRAEVMEACALENPGTMFAVLRLDAAAVVELCGGIEGVWAANYNCPGQTVVSCTLDAAEALQAAVVARGGKAMRLGVSGAFHSPMMAAAASQIADYVPGLSFMNPRIPLYSNVTARAYGDPAALLPAQIESPVLWQKTIENMVEAGFDTFIETGPGKVLSGLIRKISGEARVFNVTDCASLEKTAQEVRHA